MSDRDPAFSKALAAREDQSKYHLGQNIAKNFRNLAGKDDVAATRDAMEIVSSSEFEARYRRLLEEVGDLQAPKKHYLEDHLGHKGTMGYSIQS